MSEEKDTKNIKVKKKKKGSALLTVCLIFLVILILVLGFLIWQLVRLNNGEEFVISLPGTKTEKTVDEPVPAGTSEKASAAATEAAEQESAAETGSEAQAEVPAPVSAAGALSGEQQAVLAAAREAGVTIVPVSEQVPGPTYTPRGFSTNEAGNLVIPAQEPGRFQNEPYFAPSWQSTGDPVLDEANRQAAMYDYDAAKAVLQAIPGYENNAAYTEAIAGYDQKQSELVKWARNDLITHIFFHSLVVDTSRAFSHEIAISEQDGGDKVMAYNEVMTTVDEFVAILEQIPACSR